MTDDVNVTSIVVETYPDLKTVQRNPESVRHLFPSLVHSTPEGPIHPPILPTDPAIEGTTVKGQDDLGH